MKKSLPIIISMLILFSSMAAGAGDTPKCSDPGAKNAVIKSFKQEMRDTLSNSYSLSRMEDKDSKADIDSITNDTLFNMVGTYSANMWNSQFAMANMIAGNREVSKERKALEDRIDQRINAIKLSVSGFRMDKKEKGIPKCQCSCDISNEEGSRKTLHYTLQNSEDGQLYYTYLGAR